MEEKLPQLSLSEDEFIELLFLIKQGNKDAILQVLDFFEKDIAFLSKFIKMPQEDAMQSIRLEFIQLLKQK